MIWLVISTDVHRSSYVDPDDGSGASSLFWGCIAQLSPTIRVFEDNPCHVGRVHSIIMGDQYVDPEPSITISLSSAESHWVAAFNVTIGHRRPLEKIKHEWEYRMHARQD